MRYLLDTDHAVALLRNFLTLRSRIESLPEDVELYTSIITAAELFYGAYLSQSPSRRANEAKSFLRDVEILGLDRDAAKMYGKIKAELRKQGQLIAHV